MGWEGWFTLILSAVMLIGLLRYAHIADVIFMGGLTLLGLFGIITPTEALAGFSNTGMLTVAALFVVAAGLRESGSLDGMARRFLGQPKSERHALTRLLPPVAVFSSVLNNTTIVAMGMPVVLEWCRKNRLSPSRFLIPLSYATVAGGMMTLIGTSTNLVVHGLMLNTPAFEGKGLGFLEIGIVGLPFTIVTLAYLILVAPRILPVRQGFIEQLGAQRREYMIELMVEPICPLVGQSVQAAGLRQLPGLFLVEIERRGELISPVGPDEKLESGDRLVFVGVVSTIVDLQKIKGLVPAAEDPGTVKLTDKLGRHLCEAVVSPTSPLVGRGVREANFRTVYDAAVIAVHRHGVRLKGKIGDIVLRAGDTLLLQTSIGFMRAHRNNPDFYLVSEVGESEPIRHEKSSTAIGIMLLMIVMMAMPDLLGWIGMEGPFTELLDRGRVFFAFAAAGLMVIGRCLAPSTARRSIQWDVLFVIAASFGISTAMQKTGAASYIVELFVPLVAPLGPLGPIAAVYIIATLLTEFLTNNAAAAIVFPIAVATATKLGVDPRPFAIALAVAASAGFATPIGYQTNLMVFGPGGYKFSDFIRAGIPLNVIGFVITMIMIRFVWPTGP